MGQHTFKARLVSATLNIFVLHVFSLAEPGQENPTDAEALFIPNEQGLSADEPEAHDPPSETHDPPTETHEMPPQPSSPLPDEEVVRAVPKALGATAKSKAKSKATRKTRTPKAKASPKAKAKAKARAAIPKSLAKAMASPKSRPKATPKQKAAPKSRVRRDPVYRKMHSVPRLVH